MAHSTPATMSRGRLLAVIGPVAMPAAAYVLWWISDRMVYVGPLDRAAFGWLVVLPVLLAAPVVAGFAWRSLPIGQDSIAALAAGTIVGSGAAVLLWRAVAQTACETAPVRTAADWILPSLLIGGLVGAALAAGGLVGSRLLRRGGGPAPVIAAVGVNLLVLAAALLVFGVLVAGPGCQSPVPAG